MGSNLINFIQNEQQIIESMTTWLNQTAKELSKIPIWAFFVAIIIFELLWNLLKGMIETRALAKGITGNYDELKYYRSLSDEEKEYYNETHI